MSEKNHKQSRRLFEEARRAIPGGVDSPVRAFANVGIPPVFIEHGEGAKLYDEDGNEYLDFIGSWGPLILGHASEVCLDGVGEVMRKGTSFGLPSRLETELAERVIDAMPAVEQVRFVNSGTEAVMSALRLARGFTGREKIIKFEGGYHGHADAMLVRSGSGTLTFGAPSSAGVARGAAKDTLVARYNDAESVRRLFSQNPGQIACVIVEPVAANMGVVAPEPGFLGELRALCDDSGALLIFDEVITGFRTAYGGMQEISGVRPDLTTLGKIIGGGMPVGAFGGRAEIMRLLAPQGPVYQAGTLSGNPVAMKMGANALDYLKAHPEVYTQLSALGQRLEAGLGEQIAASGLPACVSQFHGLSTLFFTAEKPRNFEGVMASDTARYADFFVRMLDRGFLLPPSQYEGIFLSAAHTPEDIGRLVENAGEVLLAMARSS